MSGQIRYSDEFKIDAVAQVTERGYSVKEVAERLGISTKSLYTWLAKFSKLQRQTCKLTSRVFTIVTNFANSR